MNDESASYYSEGNNHPVHHGYLGNVGVISGQGRSGVWHCRHKARRGLFCHWLQATAKANQPHTRFEFQRLRWEPRGIMTFPLHGFTTRLSRHYADCRENPAKEGTGKILTPPPSVQ